MRFFFLSFAVLQDGYFKIKCKFSALSVRQVKQSFANMEPSKKQEKNHLEILKFYLEAESNF